MKVIFWLASKLLLGNIRRALFPYIGATAGVATLIVAFSIGMGGERLISSNLMAIGDNRIMIGGDIFTKRDIQIVENYPFVEYALFPKAREIENGNIFIGYSDRALEKLSLPQLSDREIIVDKNQFPNVSVGDILTFNIDNGIYEFLVKGLYSEENPFELMKMGNRVIISQNSFERIFNRYSYDEMVISFYQEEDAGEVIPVLIQKFNSDRNGYKSVVLLETPEVYKRIIKIQRIVRITLFTLAILALIISGVGITTLISSGVRARTTHIGLFRAIGMTKENTVKVFLAEGVIISILGTMSGVFLGIVGAILVGQILIIPPVFDITKIVFAILLALIIGIVMGVYPARKAGEMNIIDALRDN